MATTTQKIYKYRRARTAYACAGCKFLQNLRCETVSAGLSVMDIEPDNFGTELFCCHDKNKNPLIIEKI